MKNSETLALHWLADNLGVKAANLRHSLLRITSEDLDRATRDEPTAFVLKSDGTTDASVVDLAAKGDQAGGDVVEIAISSTQYGMLSTSVKHGFPGFDVGMNTAGDDDDGLVRFEVFGVKPDGQVHQLDLQGSEPVDFPELCVSNAKLWVRVSNLTGSAVTVALNGWSMRAKSEVSEAGRAALAAEGVPVGKAQESLVGGIMGSVASGLRGRMANGANLARAIASKNPASIASAMADSDNAFLSGVGDALSGGFLQNRDIGKALKGGDGDGILGGKGRQVVKKVGSKLKGLFSR